MSEGDLATRGREVGEDRIAAEGRELGKDLTVGLHRPDLVGARSVAAQGDSLAVRGYRRADVPACASLRELRQVVAVDVRRVEVGASPLGWVEGAEVEPSVVSLVGGGSRTDGHHRRHDGG